MEAGTLNIIRSLPLVVIVGPTASGKTSLAIEIAKCIGGEIICADSRSIYKGMDIGTAKPTQEEQSLVSHWGLDLVEPGTYFSVADFKKYALQKIEEVRGRGHVPFLVGGTGLYIDAVIFDYQFGSPVNLTMRSSLESMTLEELFQYCSKNNIELPENRKNKRYVIRAIEQGEINNRRRSAPIPNTVIVGITTKKEDLRERIRRRTEEMFKKGVVEEAIKLSEKYGWMNEAMTTNIYRVIHTYLEDEDTLEELEEKITTLDWKLAKRQSTWFQRNPYIHWGDGTSLGKYLLQILANE